MKSEFVTTEAGGYQVRIAPELKDALGTKLDQILEFLTSHPCFDICGRSFVHQPLHDMTVSFDDQPLESNIGLVGFDPLVNILSDESMGESCSIRQNDGFIDDDHVATEIAVSSMLFPFMSAWIWLIFRFEDGIFTIDPATTPNHSQVNQDAIVPLQIAMESSHHSRISPLN